MSKQDNLTDFLTDVADAIREKKGTTEKINPQNFSEEIRGIESGEKWKFIADISMMKDSYVVSPRSYLGVHIGDYDYLVVYLKNKTNGYKSAITLVENMTSGTSYDTGWLPEINSPYVYYLPLSSGIYKYVRFPFTDSSNRVLSVDDIENNYDVRVYGVNDSLRIPEGVLCIVRTQPFSVMQKKVVVPSTLKVIADGCFRGFTLTTRFIVHPQVPPTVGEASFPAISDNTYTIYVPDDSVEAYKSATNWSAYADRIKPMSEYVEPTNNE